ncbi:hypothetical protein [Streptomyces albogriseolus]|uniref:hypothetical protein n=1 Tax=Streptomyces albogriseolus TaxID=1887 RepID=UPI003CF07F2F
MPEERALDFWEITNLRRVELGKRWKDVLAETGLSHETLNRWRKGLKVDPLTDRVFERALLWRPGARVAAAEGVPPALLDETPPAPHAGPAEPPELTAELQLASRLLAATVREMDLTPEEADEVWRRVRLELEATHRSHAPGSGGNDRNSRAV